MKPVLLCLLLLFLCLDASGQVTARRLYSGSAVPTQNCVPGPPVTDLFFRTGANTLYACTGLPNTWSLVSGGGGGMADPGSNGIVKRTALNTTTVAVAGTDYLTPTGNGSSLTLSSDVMRFATAGTVTTAKTFNDSMLRFSGGTYGVNDESLPTVVVGAVLQNNDSNKEFKGIAAGTPGCAGPGDCWVERYLAGPSGVLSRLNGGTGGTGVPYDINFNFEGEPGASAIIPRTVSRAFDSGTAWAGTVCSAQVAATAQTDFLLKVNGTTKATLRFAAAGVTCTIVSGTTTALVVTDVITVIAPATPDATLADVAITLLGTLH